MRWARLDFVNQCEVELTNGEACERPMDLYTVHALNSAWKYLLSGSPSRLFLLAIANGIILFLFMYARGKVTKANYPKVRHQLHLLMVLANVAIILRDSIALGLQTALAPFQGLI
jgi:hypothetical protein